MTRKLYEIFHIKSNMSPKEAGRLVVFAGMAAGGAAGALLGCLPILPAEPVSLAAGGLLIGFMITGAGLLNVRG